MSTEAVRMLEEGNGGSLILSDENHRLEDEGVLTVRRFHVTLMSESVSDSNRFLWEVGELSKFDKMLPPHAQGTKDCTSHAWAVAVQDWLLCQFGDWYGELATEVLYGGSRIQIGNNRLNNMPGSCCAWLAGFVIKYGVVPRSVYSTYDLSKYNSSTAIELGMKGLPDDLRPHMFLPPKDITSDQDVIRVGKLRSGQEAWESLGSCCPVPFSTKRGFQIVRGPDGTCAPTGVWNHCMVARGRCIVKGNKHRIAVQNSAGDYLGEVNRRVTLEDGNTLILPPGVFLVDMEVFDDICRTEDAYVIF